MCDMKEKLIMKLWGKLCCSLLFVGIVFTLSGCGQSVSAEQEDVEVTIPDKEDKEELVAEKKKKLAEVKEEGKILIQAKRISDSKVKLSWKKADNDFVYYVYRKDTKGNAKLLKKVKSNSYTVTGLNKNKKYQLYVEIYYTWKGEENGQDVTDDIFMGKSLPLTIITGGKHFMNVKKLQAKRESVTLYKKQMHSVRCRIWLNGGKLVYGKPKLYYYSTKSSVAKVDGTGCITAKKKGKAVIFVMAPNGVYDTVSVTVK